MVFVTGVGKCLQEGCLVNEESYEVQGVNTGNSNIFSEAPRKARENKIQQVKCNLVFIIVNIYIFL